MDEKPEGELRSAVQVGDEEARSLKLEPLLCPPKPPPLRVPELRCQPTWLVDERQQTEQVLPLRGRVVMHEERSRL